MSDSVLNQFTQSVEEEKVDTGRRFKVGIIGIIAVFCCSFLSVLLCCGGGGAIVFRWCEV